MCVCREHNSNVKVLVKRCWARRSSAWWLGDPLPSPLHILCRDVLPSSSVVGVVTLQIRKRVSVCVLVVVANDPDESAIDFASCVLRATLRPNVRPLRVNTAYQATASRAERLRRLRRTCENPQTRIHIHQHARTHTHTHTYIKYYM